MIRHLLHRAARDERGSFSVEAILMFPLLVWALMSMYVFFEGLRESNINLKATYTVADLISREEDKIREIDIQGMRNIYAWLSRSQTPVSLRVSVIQYDEATDFHELKWSKGIGKDDLTQADVATVITPHVPIMADASQTIVVEAWASYDPIMNIGLTETELYNIVITPPRFSDIMRYEGADEGNGTTHDDGLDGAAQL